MHKAFASMLLFTLSLNSFARDLILPESVSLERSGYWNPQIVVKVDGAVYQTWKIGDEPGAWQNEGAPGRFEPAIADKMSLQKIERRLTQEVARARRNGHYLLGHRKSLFRESKIESIPTLEGLNIALKNHKQAIQESRPWVQAGEIRRSDLSFLNDYLRIAESQLLNVESIQNQLRLFHSPDVLERDLGASEPAHIINIYSFVSVQLPEDPDFQISVDDQLLVGEPGSLVRMQIKPPEIKFEFTRGSVKYGFFHFKVSPGVSSRFEWDPAQNWLVEN